MAPKLPQLMRMHGYIASSVSMIEMILMLLATSSCRRDAHKFFASSDDTQSVSDMISYHDGVTLHQLNLFTVY